jgi:hypothetical protein
MNLQNPQKHSAEYIMDSLQQGFNRYLHSQGLINEYIYDIDEATIILFKRTTNKSVAIKMTVEKDNSITLLADSECLPPYMYPQLTIYLETLGISQMLVLNKYH